MQKLICKKPSPSMIVAMVALFVALSGGAYAGVALNQVRSVHIKNGEVKAVDLASNAVTTAKIKAEAVNSAKVAIDSLTGADINEATLGIVPQATAATSATNATNASTADTIDGIDSAALVRTANVQPFKAKLSPGQAVAIAQNGPVSIVAECDENVAATDRVRLIGQTTQDGAFLDGVDAQAAGGLLVGTIADNREMSVVTQATGALPFVTNDTNEGFILGPEGSFIGLDGDSAVLGLNALGTKCFVAGTVFLNKL